MSHLSFIESQIEYRHVCNGLELAPQGLQLSSTSAHSLGKLTIAIVVLKNGFTVVGTSAPIEFSQYSKDVGEKMAYQQAIQQLVAFFGFASTQSRHEKKIEAAAKTEAKS